MIWGSCHQLLKIINKYKCLAKGSHTNMGAVIMIIYYDSGPTQFPVTLL